MYEIYGVYRMMGSESKKTLLPLFSYLYNDPYLIGLM